MIGEPLGRCPYCGLNINVVYDERAQADGLCHAEPPCQTFIDTEVDVIAAAMRNDLQTKLNIS